MKVVDALAGVSRLFLDTTPAIYYVEKHPAYHQVVAEVFRQIDSANITAVTSPVTLAECLVHPLLLGLTKLQQDFTDLLLNGSNTAFAPIDEQIALQATELRARYNIGLLDAFQFGVASSTNCDAFLTNDKMLARVTEIKVILVGDLEL